MTETRENQSVQSVNEKRNPRLKRS